MSDIFEHYRKNSEQFRRTPLSSGDVSTLMLAKSGLLRWRARVASRGSIIGNLTRAFARRSRIQSSPFQNIST